MNNLADDVPQADMLRTSSKDHASLMAKDRSPAHNVPMRDASGHSLLGDNQELWQQQVKLSLGHWLLVASFLRRQLVSAGRELPRSGRTP